MKMRRRGMDKIKREAIFCGTSDDPLIARRRFKTIEEVNKGLEIILKRERKLIKREMKMRGKDMIDNLECQNGSRDNERRQAWEDRIEKIAEIDEEKASIKEEITADNLFDYSKPIDISGRRNMKIIWPKEYEEFYISPDEYDDDDEDDDDDLQDNEEEPQDDDRRTGLFAKIFGRLRGERKETRNR